LINEGENLEREILNDKSSSNTHVKEDRGQLLEKNYDEDEE